MTVTFLQGDCLEQLATLPDESVNCVVTSPPYWGLRDYGVDGQIGLERTPEEYVAKMVQVFREVRRVLRADGVCWLNLGDSYATGAGKVGDCPGGGAQGERFKTYGPARAQVPDQKNKSSGIPTYQPNRMPIPGLKPKDLVGIPWMVAFALRADGWWLRRDVIWDKPNPMPESVTDRPTSSHEYIFLLTKSQRYWYDHESVKQPVSGNAHRRRKDGSRPNQTDAHDNRPGTWKDIYLPETRNLRSVWPINTHGYSGAHFATFPPDLVEICIKAGCPKGGVVLDPFGGAGTTGLVADRLQRDAILIELNPEYNAMARDRIVQSRGPLFRDECNADIEDTA